MLRGFLLGVLATIVVLAVGAYLVLRNGVIPANADAKPGRLEVWIAGTSLRATLARDAPKTRTPVIVNDFNLIDGIHLYTQHCAICHGKSKGEPSPVAKGEYPAPPQFAKDGVEDDPDGVTFWKIQHGIRWTGMPSWKGTLTPLQMWTVTMFLKNMDKLTPAAQQEWQKVH